MNIYDRQDEVDQATSIEELEKQIEKLAKVCFSDECTLTTVA